MAFWNNIWSRIRRVFGGRAVTPPPLPPPVPAILKKQFVNIIWGHILYKPTKKANWDIKRGMATLDEFLEWGRQQDMEQEEDRKGKGSHPVALEVYAGLSLDQALTKNTRGFFLIKKALEDAITNTYPEFSGGILDWMEFGVETAETDKEKELEAIKRWSRDGESFEEKDITNFVENRIRELR